MQQRSSFARLQRASVCRAQEQPSLSPEPLPNAPFGQPRSSREPTRTAFEVLFSFRTLCRTRQAPHQFLEVQWLTYPVPSLTTGRLGINWSLNSPSPKDCTAIAPYLRKQPHTFRITNDAGGSVTTRASSGSYPVEIASECSLQIHWQYSEERHRIFSRCSVLGYSSQKVQHSQVTRSPDGSEPKPDTI